MALSTRAATYLCWILLTGSGSGAWAADRPCGDDTERVARGERGKRIDVYLERLAGYGYSGAAAVVAGDDSVVAGYGAAGRERELPATAATPFDLGSLTKQFTAAAVLALEQDGKLRVEDPLGAFFKDVPEDKAGITLHHLLTHSSGLKSGFFRDADRVSREKLIETALKSELASAPGEVWRYSNTGYSLLAAVIEVVAGEPYERYLKRRLFEPAGLAHTGYRLGAGGDCAAHGYRRGEDTGPPLALREESRLDELWAFVGNGGMVASAADVARWHRALQGDAVLATAARRKLFAPHVPQPTGYGSHYGYGWFIDEATGRAMHGGSNTIYTADVRRGVTDGELLFTASSVAEFTAPSIGRRLVRILAGEEVTRPPAVTAAEPGTIERLQGTCDLDAGGRLTARSGEGGVLVIEAEGPAAIALLFAPDDDSRRRLAEDVARTALMVSASGRGDHARQREALGPTTPPSVIEALEDEGMWGKLRADNGTFERVEELGAWSEGGFSRVALELVFDRGAEQIKYSWAGERLVAVNSLDQPPRRVFHPIAPDELAALDPASLEPTRLVVETAAGAPRALAFTARGDRVVARCLEPAAPPAP